MVNLQMIIVCVSQPANYQNLVTDRYSMHVSLGTLFSLHADSTGICRCSGIALVVGVYPAVAGWRGECTTSQCGTLWLAVVGPSVLVTPI